MGTGEVGHTQSVERSAQHVCTESRREESAKDSTTEYVLVGRWCVLANPYCHQHCAEVDSQACSGEQGSENKTSSHNFDLRVIDLQEVREEPADRLR